MSEKPEHNVPRHSSSEKNTMAGQPAKKIRLENLTVQNFKALGHFSVEFPPPRMEHDPDILAIGSSNGLGKTSILEACSMLCYGAVMGTRTLDMKRYAKIIVDLPDLMIRAGTDEAQIQGTFVVGEETAHVILTLQRSRTLIINSDDQILRKAIKEPSRDILFTYASEVAANFLGLTSDPLILPPFMYFHSYRKVQEGRFEPGRLMKKPVPHRDADIPTSTFKLEILRMLMSREGLFEGIDSKNAKEAFSSLDKLMHQFAHVSIGKLRLAPDGTMDLRIIPDGGDSNQSYTFDCLSSGQKEIVSTLFLIWHYTQKQPGIVLIDEPELHLNAEWHRSFIHYLHQLAPDNQYIIATHSEDIFAAVDADRRILIVPDKEK